MEERILKWLYDIKQAIVQKHIPKLKNEVNFLIEKEA